jgi:hypothetical protein
MVDYYVLLNIQQAQRETVPSGDFLGAAKGVSWLLVTLV